MPGARRAVAALLAAVGWLALVLQLGIMLRNAANAGTSLLGAVGSFLSFFTVLANLLVAVALAATVPALPPRALRPLIEPPGATALAAYITVVGVVYTSSSGSSGTRRAPSSWPISSCTTSCRSRT